MPRAVEENFPIGDSQCTGQTLLSYYLLHSQEKTQTQVWCAAGTCQDFILKTGLHKTHLDILGQPLPVLSPLPALVSPSVKSNVLDFASFWVHVCAFTSLFSVLHTYPQPVPGLL